MCQTEIQFLGLQATFKYSTNTCPVAPTGQQRENTSTPIERSTRELWSKRQHGANLGRGLRVSCKMSPCPCIKKPKQISFTQYHDVYQQGWRPTSVQCVHAHTHTCTCIAAHTQDTRMSTHVYAHNSDMPTHIHIHTQTCIAYTYAHRHTRTHSLVHTHRPAFCNYSIKEKMTL